MFPFVWPEPYSLIPFSWWTPIGVDIVLIAAWALALLGALGTQSIRGILRPTWPAIRAVGWAVVAVAWVLEVLGNALLISAGEWVLEEYSLSSAGKFLYDVGVTLVAVEVFAWIASQRTDASPIHRPASAVVGSCLALIGFLHMGWFRALVEGSGYWGRDEVYAFTYSIGLAAFWVMVLGLLGYFVVLLAKNRAR